MARASHLPQARGSPRIRNVAAVASQLCSRHLAPKRKGKSMKLPRTAHLISVRALVIVIAAVAGIAGLLVTAGSGASAHTGSAHARSAPSGAALTAQRACQLNPSPPAGFIERKVKVNGIGINYVRGGHGPTLLLLHG